MRSNASTWIATRYPTPPVAAHSTWTMRSGWESRFAALVQSRRCTETPFSRVTNPMMASPGNGVQHLASFTHMSGSPSTTTPASFFPVDRRLGAAIRMSSEPSSTVASRPPAVSTRRCTTP